LLNRRHRNGPRSVAVGDRKVIDSQIASLHLGPIGYRTPDGRPVPAQQAVKMPVP